MPSGLMAERTNRRSPIAGPIRRGSIVSHPTNRPNSAYGPLCVADFTGTSAFRSVPAFFIRETDAGTADEIVAERLKLRARSSVARLILVGSADFPF